MSASLRKHRSAALPRIDAICHLRKVRTYSDTAGKNDSGARPPYFVEAVGRRGLIISGNTLDLLGTSSQPEAAFDAAGASSFLLDRANDRRECRSKLRCTLAFATQRDGRFIESVPPRPAGTRALPARPDAR